MQVIVEDGEVAEAGGNTCRRGAVYAKQECIVPQHMVTAVVKAQNSKFPVSVKTQAPIPKNRKLQVQVGHSGKESGDSGSRRPELCSRRVRTCSPKSSRKDSVKKSVKQLFRRVIAQLLTRVPIQFIRGRKNILIAVFLRKTPLEKST